MPALSANCSVPVLRRQARMSKPVQWDNYLPQVKTSARRICIINLIRAAEALRA